MLLVLIRHLWQLKTVVFLHWCLICAVSRHLWQLKTVVFLHWCLICALLFSVTKENKLNRISTCSSAGRHRTPGPPIRGFRARPAEDRPGQSFPARSRPRWWRLGSGRVDFRASRDSRWSEPGPGRCLEREWLWRDLKKRSSLLKFG